MIRRAFTITKLTDEPGYWTANVNGCPVDREHGSWQMTSGGRRMDVLPGIAAMLQAKVLFIERSRQRGARTCA